MYVSQALKTEIMRWLWLWLCDGVFIQTAIHWLFSSQASSAVCEPGSKPTKTSGNLSSDARKLSEAAINTGCRFFPSLKNKISKCCTKCLRLLLISHKLPLMIRHNSMHFTWWYFTIWLFMLYVVWTDQILFMCLEEGDRKADFHICYKKRSGDESG